MAAHALFTVSRPPEHLAVRIAAIRREMRRWGMTPAQVAMGLGVSRQYVWVILQGRTYVSDAKLGEIEKLVGQWIERQREAATAGQRLRAARLYAGLTLKEVAELIGYSWVAVERWEQDRCLPKPGVLWHLRHLYCVGEDWIPATARHPRQRQTTPISLGA
jgi:transcriptional regulator with XRE-family HTH domain